MSYRVGIGPSARALELMDASTCASPPTSNPEFRDKYAHAREAGRVFGVFRRLYAAARFGRNGLGRPNFQLLETLKGALPCCFVMPPKSYRQRERWTT